MLPPFTSTSRLSCRGHPAPFPTSHPALGIPTPPSSPLLDPPDPPGVVHLDNTIHQQRNGPRAAPGRGPCCAALPCLLSPLTHPRAVLGARRNPSWPSSQESDLQSWGPQASVQAVPINIEQRGCPRVLSRHILSLGQVLALAWCQAVVLHGRVLPVGTGSPCMHIPWTAAGRVRAGAGASRWAV